MLCGDWLICELDAEVLVGEEVVGFVTTDGLGVLNAPVEDLCSRSNSSCSFGGRRSGAGPFVKAGRKEV